MCQKAIENTGRGRISQRCGVLLRGQLSPTGGSLPGVKKGTVLFFYFQTSSLGDNGRMEGLENENMREWVNGVGVSIIHDLSLLEAKNGRVQSA
jgi:hypothetical protein